MLTTQKCIKVGYQQGNFLLAFFDEKGCMKIKLLGPSFDDVRVFTDLP